MSRTAFQNATCQTWHWKIYNPTGFPSCCGLCRHDVLLCHLFVLQNGSNQLPCTLPTALTNPVMPMVPYHGTLYHRSALISRPNLHISSDRLLFKSLRLFPLPALATALETAELLLWHVFRLHYPLVEGHCVWLRATIHISSMEGIVIVVTLWLVFWTRLASRFLI